MKMMLLLSLVSAGAIQAPVEDLPTAIGENCPQPPATVSFLGGHLYQCEPEEGEDAYKDVTPPDDSTHWSLNFGSIEQPPRGTSNFRWADAWPFRSIVIMSLPVRQGRDAYYIFDHNGTVIDSSKQEAIGERMAEMTISGLRVWPTANVYYRMPTGKNGDAGTDRDPMQRVNDPSYFALIVDQAMLCPILRESEFVNWPRDRRSGDNTGTYINGHCGDAESRSFSFPGIEHDPQTYYMYPGFPISKLEIFWTFQRHDEPERPVRDRKGKCVALCGSDESNR